MTLISFPTLKKASFNKLESTINLSQQINCEIQIHAGTKVILNKMSNNE